MLKRKRLMPLTARSLSLRRKSRARDRPSKTQRPRRLPIKLRPKPVKRMLAKLLPSLRLMPRTPLAPLPRPRRRLRRRRPRESRKRRRRLLRRRKRPRRPKPTLRPPSRARLLRMLSRRTETQQRRQPMLTRPMQTRKRLPRRLMTK